MNSLAFPTLTKESGLQKYLEEIKKFPILSEKDEHELAMKWYDHGDLLSAQKLVTSHLRLVAKVAMQFKGYGLPVMDIISEGNIGLMTAVKKFNPYLGYRLATYAIWWVKANIQDYILKSWSTVKMGTSAVHKKLFFNLRKIKNKLLHANNGAVLPNESEIIANELDVSKFDVEELSNSFNNNHESLNNTPFNEGNVEVINLIAEPSDNQEILLLEHDDYNHKKNKFEVALNTLNDRERYIIQERRLNEKPTKLEVLGKKLAVSSERIRQIEDRAMQKLIAYVRN